MAKYSLTPNTCTAGDVFLALCISAGSCELALLLLLKGPSAESAMQYLCANNVAGPKGSVVTTGMLNTHGGYESSCTVVRLDKNK